jgi:hypothetical protein
LVLADTGDSNDNNDKEVSSDSTGKEKSSGKNTDNDEARSSEKSDEKDPPRQDDQSKQEEPPTNEEQNPPEQEEPPTNEEQNPPEQEPPKEEPPKQEPPDHESPKEEPPKQEPPAPVIITNTVTAPSVSSSSDEDDDEDENEGPTKFAFIDSFFTDQTAQGSVIAATSSDSSATQDIPPVTKQEVGPGEGDSVLAIVLINRGFSDVTSIRASLDFPSGFSSNITPKNIDNDTSLASYNGLVEAGQTFTLYFPVNISKDTQVGKEYTASLNIDYFNIAEKDEENMRDRTIKVPFMLSGKVILDTLSFSFFESSHSVNQTFPDRNSNVPNVVSLVPGEPNVVQTLVKNEGSAAATGVIVEVSSRNQQDQFDNGNLIPTSSNNGNGTSTTLQQSTVIPLISAGTTTFNVGTIPAGESIQINPVIFASNSVGSILENIDLRISYNNAYGYKKTLDKSMGVHILPSSPQSGLTLSSSLTTSKTTSNSPARSNNLNQNNGEYGLVSTENHGANKQNLTYPITQVSEFVSDDNLPMLNDIQSNSTSNIDSSLDTTSNRNTISLIAGRVDELRFNITNTNDNPIIDAVISLDSESSSIKIIGDSKWNLNKIDPLTTEQFETRVFASKSLINSPVSFKISIQYLDNNEAKSDSFNLGANVIGDITVNINDLAINYIGGSPNLIGNILNKGNTLALFTTIEILNSSSSAIQGQEQLPSSAQTFAKKTILIPASSFPQYLGDLEENSPLPFSIPLAMNNNTSSGVYPVSLKVTYSDDLRNSYTVINNGTVEFISPVPTTNKGQGFLGNYDSLLILIIFAIVGIVSVLVFRRLRSKRKTGNNNTKPGHSEGDSGNDNANDKGNNEDIESLLGEEGSNFK